MALQPVIFTSFRHWYVLLTTRIDASLVLTIYFLNCVVMAIWSKMRLPLFLLMILVLLVSRVYGQEKANQREKKFTLIRWAGKSVKEIDQLNSKIANLSNTGEMEKVFLRETSYFKSEVLVLVQEKDIIYPWFNNVKATNRGIDQKRVLTRGKGSFPLKVSSQAELIELFEGSLILLDTLKINIKNIRGIDEQGFYVVKAIGQRRFEHKAFLRCSEGTLLIVNSDLEKEIANGEQLELYNKNTGQIILGKFSLITPEPHIRNFMATTYSYFRKNLGYSAQQAAIPIYKYLTLEYGKTSPIWLQNWLETNQEY